MRYGSAPFTVALVHGGPGAAGELTPVARELATHCGVLEPLQTALTVDGQVEELESLLRTAGAPPLTVAGFSWGAWLALLLAARAPATVKKLILISAAPFEEKFAAGIAAARSARLNREEQRTFDLLLAALEGSEEPDPDDALARLGALMTRADACDPLDEVLPPVEFRAELFRRIWPQAAELRASGKLLEETRKIQCPVVAIHGDYDPHPAEGVREPLAQRLSDFRFHLLADCGHRPWIERRARLGFFEILRAEIQR